MSAPWEPPLDQPATDVWLAFDDPEDDEPSHEANIYRGQHGATVEWYHTAVGLVSSRHFDTYADARSWLEAAGYQDFSA